jgi:hypothetical protein
MASAREIVEEQRAQESLDAWCKQDSRVADVWLGFTWRLARDPLVIDCQGEPHAVEIPHSEPPTFLAKTTPIVVGDPVITALYQFDAEQIIVLDISVRKAKIIP